MLVIGERINTSRGELLQAVANKDAHAIQSEAVRQRDAGADILDVNCGSLPTHEEPEALRWLVKAVQEASSLELCIDSPNPDALAAGLAVHQGKPLINSISGESDRYTGVLPLAKEYGASVIALGINDDGIPQDESQALEIGKHLLTVSPRTAFPWTISTSIHWCALWEQARRPPWRPCAWQKNWLSLSLDCTLYP